MITDIGQEASDIAESMELSIDEKEEKLEELRDQVEDRSLEEWEIAKASEIIQHHVDSG